MPVRAIARQLGHSPPTVRAYLHQRRTPAAGPSQPACSPTSSPTTAASGSPRTRTCGPAALFRELTELGFRGSRATFYRGLTRPGCPIRPPAIPDPGANPAGTRPGCPASRPHTQHAAVLPRPVTPITGESLNSYLTRLAHANHLTLTEVLAVLPSWFSTKISNRDERAQHHMLIPAATEALRALAHLTSTTPPASPAPSPPSAPPARTALSGPPPPATGAPPAAASTSPSPSTCPPTTRSAPDMASGSATPASPTSTSPPARRSSPPSTAPTGSCAATHPSNWCSPTRPRPKRSHPGQPHQQPSRSTGGTGSSPCRPPTTATAPPPTTTPTRTQRSTPTPSPSPQPSSTLPPRRAGITGKTLHPGTRRANFDGTTPITLLPLKEARAGQGHTYRADLSVTGHRGHGRYPARLLQVERETPAHASARPRACAGQVSCDS